MKDYFYPSTEYNLNIRIGDFIIYLDLKVLGMGKKKPQHMMRKAAEAKNGGEIEVWGDGKQTRSFLHVDECIEAVLKLMESNFMEPVNIGSEEMVSINELAKIAIEASKKKLTIHNIWGKEFKEKYGFECPLGVMGRNSHHKLYHDNVGWQVSQPLKEGMMNTYKWIESHYNK